MKQLLTFIFLLFTTIGLWSAPADAALIKHIGTTNMAMPIYVAPTYSKGVFGIDSWTVQSVTDPTIQRQSWVYWFTNFYCTNLTQCITNPAIVLQKLSDVQANYATLIRPYASDATTNGTNAILFLNGGINDILAPTAAATLYATLEAIIALAKADKFIVVIYTVPCIQFELDFGGFDWNRVAYNSLVRKNLTADYIVDVDNDWNPSDYLPGNNMHPSNIGGRRIAELTAITLRGECLTNKIAVIRSLAGGGGGGTSNNVPGSLSYSTTNVVINATNATTFTLLATNDFMLLINAGHADQAITIRIQQDATGSRRISMTNMFHFGTDITGVTLTTNAGAVDYLRAQYWLLSNRWDVIGFVRSYQ